MKNKNLWLGYEIATTAGPILSPTAIMVWSESEYKNHTPDEPLFYKSDALVGISILALQKKLKQNKSLNDTDSKFLEDCWSSLEPHFEMYKRSQPRLNEIRKYLKPFDTEKTTYFESEVNDVLSLSIKKDLIDLKCLTGLIEKIEHFESEINSPLLFNYQIQFSKEMQEKLHYLHSLLFNLRSLVGLYYNSNINDICFESIKMDSITDYLHKPEYLANDALLYLNFKKLKSQMPADVADKLEQKYAFYAHHSICLIENLPNHYFSSKSTESLEESLYVAQMDWLLGSSAGLLFRVREELFGLQNGYEKVFWPELDGKMAQKPRNISINCELNESDLFSYGYKKSA